MHRPKVIRTMWGDYKHFVKEIPKLPRFNETVLTWGPDNTKYLTSLGYRCVEVSSDNHLSKYNPFERFILKVEGWVKACEMFGSILFLDWDIETLKYPDEKFWKSLEGKKFSAPVYAYPKGFETPDIVESREAQGWLDIFAQYLPDYSWKWDDLRILPNAGFVYLGGVETAKEILDICNKYELRGLIEEFALFKLANCSLEEYLHKYEPIVTQGRPDRHVHQIGSIKNHVSIKINDHVRKFVEKDLYFDHF